MLIIQRGIMRRSFLFLLVLAGLLLFSSCGDDTKSKCLPKGATRCVGNILQICADGSWLNLEDCNENGNICAENNDDETDSAACVKPDIGNTGNSGDSGNTGNTGNTGNSGDTGDTGNSGN